MTDDRWYFKKIILKRTISTSCCVGSLPTEQLIDIFHVALKNKHGAETAGKSTMWIACYSTVMMRMLSCVIASYFTWILLGSCRWRWAGQTADMLHMLLTLWTDCCPSESFSSVSWRTAALTETLGLQVVWPVGLYSDWSNIFITLKNPPLYDCSPCDGKRRREDHALTIISVAKSHSEDFLSRVSSASSKGSLKLLMQLHRETHHR